MLRTVLAAVAAALAIGLVGAPTAEARCYGTGPAMNPPTCSPDERFAPTRAQQEAAVHRIADPIVKKIVDKIRGHHNNNSARTTAD